MAMNTEWLRMNTLEIAKRTVHFRQLNRGKIIVIQGDEFKEINLINCDESEFEVVTRNLIRYENLKNADNIEERILIILDAVRDIDFQFYFDYSVTKMIFNK